MNYTPIVLPFHPTKGQQFTLILGGPQMGNGNQKAYISKDGSSFVNTTNTSSTLITSDNTLEAYSITLTASEMNANVIVLSLNATNAMDFGVVTIYTVPSQPTTLDTPVTNISSISGVNPTLQEVISLMWLGMTNRANQKGWSFSTWLNKFTF